MIFNTKTQTLRNQFKDINRVEEKFSHKKNNGSQPAVARIAQKPLGV